MDAIEEKLVIKDFTEKMRLNSELFELIYPILAKYESRSHDAPTETQAIIQDVLVAMDKFIERKSKGEN